MADLKVTRFVIDGKTFVIPAAAAGQAGLMSGSDYSKLAGIASGAQANVIEGVKVNGTALAIASKIVDVTVASGAANGTLSVNGADVAVKGLAALAYKANVSKTDLDTALQTAINQVDTNKTAINTLNGTGAGSVKKAIDDAFNTFSTNVSNDGVVNSYKELIDWAAEHGGDAAEMAASITNIEGLLAGIGGTGEPATVQAAITAAINGMGIGNYYTKTQADDKFVAKVSGKGLSTNDFTAALKTKLDGIAAGATKNTYSHDATTETLTLTGFVAG